MPRCVWLNRSKGSRKSFYSWMSIIHPISVGCISDTTAEQCNIPGCILFCFFWLWLFNGSKIIFNIWRFSGHIHFLTGQCSCFLWSYLFPLSMCKLLVFSVTSFLLQFQKHGMIWGAGFYDSIELQDGNMKTIWNSWSIYNLLYFVEFVATPHFLPCAKITNQTLI